MCVGLGVVGIDLEMIVEFVVDFGIEIVDFGFCCIDDEGLCII